MRPLVVFLLLPAIALAADRATLPLTPVLLYSTEDVSWMSFACDGSTCRFRGVLISQQTDLWPSRAELSEDEVAGARVALEAHFKIPGKLGALRKACATMAPVAVLPADELNEYRRAMVEYDAAPGRELCACTTAECAAAAMVRARPHPRVCSVIEFSFSAEMTKTANQSWRSESGSVQIVVRRDKKNGTWVFEQTKNGATSFMKSNPDDYDPHLPRYGQHALMRCDVLAAPMGATWP